MEIGARALGKELRRARILDAARALVREGGTAYLSMRTLAERASVSLATPYALIGSRDKILMHLLDQDFAKFRAAFDADASRDAVGRIFDVPRIASRLYRNAPDYHRGILAEVYSLNRVVRENFTGVRREFWRELAIGARTDQVLNRSIDPDIFRLVIEAVYTAALSNWAWGSLDLDDFVPHVDYGFAAVLRGACTARFSTVLRARLIAAQAQLGRVRAAPPAAMA